MSMPELVVTAVRVQGRSKSEVARAHGPSRRWVHELVRARRPEPLASGHAGCRLPQLPVACQRAPLRLC